MEGGAAVIRPEDDMVVEVVVVVTLVLLEDVTRLMSETSTRTRSVSLMAELFHILFINYNFNNSYY